MPFTCSSSRVILFEAIIEEKIRTFAGENRLMPDSLITEAPFIFWWDQGGIFK